MKKSILLLSVLLFSINFANSQRIINKLKRQTCRCIKKENISELEEIEKCFLKVSKRNFKRIKRIYKTDSTDYETGVKIGELVGWKLQENCTIYKAILKEEEKQ
jgi:hypothetical protein